MLTWYFWLCLLLLPLGYYHSALGVVHDFWSTYTYLPNSKTTSSLTAEIPLSGIIPIVSTIFQIFVVCSAIYLLDRIPDILTGKRPNRQVTTYYPSIGVLGLDQLYQYLSQIPNVITLSIGLVQTYSTWQIVWLAPGSWTINWIMIMNSLCMVYSLFSCGYRYRRNLPVKSKHIWVGLLHLGCLMVCRWWGLPMIKAKIINVIVSLACFNLALYKEFQRHRSARVNDQLVNETLIWRKSNSKLTNHRHTVRADTLELGDEIWLAYGETTPATVEVVSLDWLPSGQSSETGFTMTRSLPKVGYVDHRESSGEDVSRSFSVGDTLRSGLRLTRPHLSIRGRVTSFRTSIKPTSSLSVLPNYLNRPWSWLDGFAVSLLCLLSLSISGSANQLFVGRITTWSILEHIISTVIAGNILIPSMKMTLLYQVYNLVLSLSFTEVSIQDAPAIPRIESVQTVIFDKTGTLTTDQLQVTGHIDEASLSQISSQLGWSDTEIKIALALANSESNLITSEIIPADSSQAWGTSPEECEILNYWHSKVGIMKLWNPLGTEEIGQENLEFSVNQDGSGQLRRVKIIRRLDYRFQYGKIAEIVLLGESHDCHLYVRQHGSDFYPNYTGSSDRRSMTIGWTSVTDTQSELSWEEIPWHLATTYQFETPLRDQIPQMMKYLWEKKVSTSILTGDGKEAAEATGRDVGFPLPIIRVTDSDTPDTILTQLTTSHSLQTVSIEGRQLENWLDTEPSQVTQFLSHPKACRVMSRVPKPLKARVVEASDSPMYLGDAANDLLAIKSATVGIALSHGAEICRLNSDIIMKEPANLLDLLVPNGYRDMLLRGGELLLADVSWLCGLLAGSLAVGLHYNQFRRLQHTVIYEDTWDPFTMLFISSFQYTVSVIAYVSGSVAQSEHIIPTDRLTQKSIQEMIAGLVLGLTLAWGWKQLVTNPNLGLDIYLPDFPRLTLIGIDTMILLRHSWPSYCRTEQLGRPFGNQNRVMDWRGADKTSPFLMVLSIMDSIPFRIIWLGIFISLT